MAREERGGRNDCTNEVWEKRFAIGKSSFDGTAGSKEKEESLNWTFLKVPAATLVAISGQERDLPAGKNSLLKVSACCHVPTSTSKSQSQDLADSR
ncbi:MAG: hypothetical protein GXY54_07990 [Deltaproteobacteria bacterium]|nr:hypothetical protein [Deltaproteobacteria bacterium]